MGRSFINRTDPSFDDLGRREVVNVRCKCGREVQIAPYRLIGQHGIQLGPGVLDPPGQLGALAG